MTITWKPYEEFKLWFKWINNDGVFGVINKETNSKIGTVSNGHSDPSVLQLIETSGYSEADVLNEFNQFKERPEYLVGQTFNTDNMDSVEMKSTYEMLIAGCCYIKALNSGKDPDTTMNNKIHKILAWLSETDFYTEPSSTYYHANYVYGNLKHTLNVVSQIVKLSCLDKFVSVNIESAVFVALVHDWCKIGRYEHYQKNVKNEATGQWEKQDAYKYADNVKFPFGHGEASAFVASNFFKLSMDEYAAIRWHMGFSRIDTSSMNDLQQCNENIPLVHMLQFADQLAIVKY